MMILNAETAVGEDGKGRNNSSRLIWKRKKTKKERIFCFLIDICPFDFLPVHESDFVFCDFRSLLSMFVKSRRWMESMQCLLKKKLVCVLDIVVKTMDL